MTVKEYNEWYSKLNTARSFVHCIDHALQKSDENANMQFRVIGWSEELKDFLNKAIECYADKMHNQTVCPPERKQASARFQVRYGKRHDLQTIEFEDKELAKEFYRKKVKEIDNGSLSQSVALWENGWILLFHCHS